jgi:hypothetical protein
MNGGVVDWLACPSGWLKQGVQEFEAGANVSPAAFSPNRHTRGMIAQQEGSRGPIATDIVDQSPL